MGERNDSSGARYFARLSESSLTNRASPNAVNPCKRSCDYFKAQSALSEARMVKFQIKPSVPSHCKSLQLNRNRRTSCLIKNNREYAPLSELRLSRFRLYLVLFYPLSFSRRRALEARHSSLIYRVDCPLPLTTETARII